jgi:circadian clock protein KaiC
MIRQLPSVERLLTGIHGLDAILHGGLLQSGIYIVMGPPGAGKTVLGNQLCFNHVAAGGRAVYIGLLSETHTQMFAHLQSMAFFTHAPIAKTLYYFSGYGILEQEGLKGLLEFVRQVINDHRPTLLMMDGLVTAEMLATSGLELKQFFNDLHAYLEAHRCTGVLLNHAHSARHFRSTHTIVDGLISLKARFIGARYVRELQVHKFRGSAFVEGRHAYQITNAGIVVHPRTESTPIQDSDEPGSRDRLPFGVAQLDAMLDGGLLAGSATMLLGIPGSGKTLLGLHFLTTGARAGQPGLYFGFNEKPSELIDSAKQVSLDVASHVLDGVISLIWQPPLDHILDALAEKLLDAVRQHKTQRLFIDGFGGFQEGIADAERINRFFIALTAQLDMLNVTTLFSVEMNNLFGPAINVPIGAASAIADNIIFLRYVELRAKLYRLISVLKSRRSRHDSEIREFKIMDKGLQVADTFESAQTILTGLGQRTSSAWVQTAQLDENASPEQP